MDKSIVKEVNVEKVVKDKETIEQELMIKDLVKQIKFDFNRFRY